MNDKIFVITGPSGAGEDSIIKGLEEKIDFDKAITTTTRKMRPFESDGNPYYFISSDEFKDGIAHDKFFEYAEEDRNNYYGVTKEEIERVMNSEKVKIWKIDYKGALTAKEKLGDRIVIIYISVLRDQMIGRLEKRAGSTPEFITSRLEYMKGWEGNKDKWDYEVSNLDGKLELSIAKVQDIILSYNNIVDNL